MELEDLYPIPQFASEHSRVISEAQLRWQLRYRDQNGLSDACVRVGNRLLISKSRYQAWLATQAGATKHARGSK